MDQLSNLREENTRLRKAIDELSTLNELSRVISSTMSLDVVNENIIKRSVKAVHGQQGMITLVEEASPNSMFTLIRTLDSNSNQQQFHLNQNILGWMMMNKKPLISNDFSNDMRFSGINIEGDIHSLLCVPLLTKNHLIGILAVFNKKENGTFTNDDTRILSIIASQSAQVIENARLYEQEKSLHSIQEEIKLAAKIQFELLPKKSPVVPGYEIAGKSIPAQLVGGDYFDFIPIDKKRLAIGLGDVSGKGLPASLLMANLQATLRGQAIVSSSVKECINRSNKLLHQSSSSEKFVTLFYGVLDTELHQLNYCNTGHDPPFYLSEGKDAKRLDTGEIVLGIMEHFPFEEEVINLHPGDLLVVYSDGITEAMNSNREQFGEESLARILQEHQTLSASDLIEKIIEVTKSHIGDTKQWDDMTLLVIKRLKS